MRQVGWNKYVEIDPRYYRPTEVDLLLGDASKARKMWLASASEFDELVRMMVESDLETEARRPCGRGGKCS
jgi:GDPmannose 4,6-dehydratase